MTLDQKNDIKKKNCLIIGFGSAGQKHFRILKRKKHFNKFYVFSKNCNNKDLIKITKLENLDNYNLGYIIISSETWLHYKHYSKVKNLKNVKILIEKPVFNFLPKKLKNNKNVFVGYNLRFNPLIQFLKKFFKKNKAFLCSIECGYYLPFWRKGRAYFDCYSSYKTKGGGALNDLSHEIDYALWILGDLEVINSYNQRISDLKIKSDDIALFVCKSKKAKIINFNLNYLSRKRIRIIKFETKNKSLICDLVKNEVMIFSKKNKVKKIKWPIDKGYLQTFKKMHDEILGKKIKNVTTLNEGIKVLKILKKI